MEELAPARVHCCEDMKFQAEYFCPTHPHFDECPDKLVSYDVATNSYRLIVRHYGPEYADDSVTVIGPDHFYVQAYMAIQHCPWCTAALPDFSDLRTDALEAMGIDDSYSEDVPAEFETDLWWRRREGADSAGPGKS